MDIKQKNLPSIPKKIKGKDDVFDTAFSKLMQDFSEKLSSSSSDVVTAKKKSNETSQQDDEIVAPLKNFHIQTAANSEYGPEKQKTKKRSSNEFNLSVAAGFIHRPVVWPARLSAPSSGSLSKKLLHPARLIAAMSLCQCSKGECKKSCVEQKLNKKVIDLLKKNTALDLSNVSVNKKLVRDQCLNRIFGDAAVSTDQLKQQSSFSSVNLSNNSKKQKCDNSFIDLKNSTSTLTSSSNDATGEVTSQNNMLFANFQNNNRLSENNMSFRPSSTPAASSEDSTLARSCSHEVRLEETNVNELASYFDDMLHLPRPMSTMAEMMYA